MSRLTTYAKQHMGTCTISGNIPPDLHYLPCFLVLVETPNTLLFTIRNRGFRNKYKHLLKAGEDDRSQPVLFTFLNT